MGIVTEVETLTYDTISIEVEPGAGQTIAMSIAWSTHIAPRLLLWRRIPSYYCVVFFLLLESNIKTTVFLLVIVHAP